MVTHKRGVVLLTFFIWIRVPAKWKKNLLKFWLYSINDWTLILLPNTPPHVIFYPHLIWLLRKFGKFVQEKLSQYITCLMFVVFSKIHKFPIMCHSFICLILEIESGGSISFDMDKKLMSKIFLSFKCTVR